MKKTLIVVTMLVTISSIAVGGWKYEEDFVQGPLAHGVVVDNDGKIWIGYYGYTDTLGLPTDTIPIKPIYVYESDGTEASFSPIRFVTIDGQVDTMFNGCRGITLDHNGNILYSAYNDIWRINYQTGEGIAAIHDLPGSLTEAAVTSDGYMFLTMVVPNGNPIWVYDEDFELVNTVVDSNFHISRSLLVTADGKDLYHGVIYGSKNGIVHYHSDTGPEGTDWVVVDTLYKSTDKMLWAQCLDWGPNGNIWVGTYWDVGPNDYRGWYALDPNQDYAMVDSIGSPWKEVGAVGAVPALEDTIYAPRGITWTADGKTAYTADFDGSVIKKWSWVEVGVEPDVFYLPKSFTLFQNFPNPFNPTTTIPFDITENGFVKLTIFDMLGRKVSTLIEKPMKAGHYEIPFDATGLSAGVYIYRLELDFQIVSKRMIYLK